MKRYIAAGLITFAPALTAQDSDVVGAAMAPAWIASSAHRTVADTLSYEAINTIVRNYCWVCHNEVALTGNLDLGGFQIETIHERGEIGEKMIRKLRAGMMPLPGAARPSADTLDAMMLALERRLDDAWAEDPNPGARSFQRLNRAEYAAAVEDLLTLRIDGGDYLPLDTKSANFDNIADVQLLSATLMDSYLRAAADVARLAIGDPNAIPSSHTYTNPGYATQWERIDGAPRGTRGGISVVHNFPADGEYVLRLAFEHTTTGGFYGRTGRNEQIEISINGERRALLHVDRWMSVADPNGANMQTEPIFIPAGPQRVTAAFLRISEGPKEDLVSPHEWSLADRQIGVSGYGVTALAHLKDLVISGPHKVTGVSDTPSRRAIFSCRPTAPAEERPCAREILGRLAPVAYRRTVTDGEIDDLLAFYDEGAAESGFETGVRTALQAVLASPDFLFRFERVPSGARPGDTYRIADPDLASRLSFFLWGTPPDEVLIEAAARNELSDDDRLRAQVDRMLADPRSRALATRFASQWLRLEDLEKVHPDRLMFPDYYQQLSDDMIRETEEFFYSLVREDRSMLDMFTADYSYMNERLARHYGIPDVTGNEFRRVTYPDDTRRGLLGHGSILTLTSHANRTSPVLRGKWVMEVFLGTPPPPPPPGVPDLEQTEGTANGRMLTTRERMEMHRASPVCRSCHLFMDPIGLALDQFDVIGRWRIRENGMPLDTRGEMYDGTPVTSPADLRASLLKRPVPLVRNFTSNLMAYALGRRVEYFDQPTVRAIVREAENNDYRMSAFIHGVINSPAFRMGRVMDVVTDDSVDENNGAN